MAEFTVTVEGKDYDVTAPDERTAWAWANHAHRQGTAPSRQGEQAEESSIGQRIGRQAGLGARGLIKGALAIPTMMAEGAAYPLRAATGGRYFQSPSAVLERTMTEAGLPEPASAPERVGQDVIGTMTGVGTVAKGADILARGASAVAKPYLGMLAANPLGQQLSAAGAGAGGGIARESGAGPTGQTLAAAGGALLPGVGPAVMAPIHMGRNIVDPWLPGGIGRMESRVLNKLAGSKRAATIAALKADEQMVLGSVPTAAQAAAPAGSAEFVAAENFARRRLPSAYEDITQAQNAARIRALRSVGQDKAALEAAMKARGVEAATKYGAIRDQLVDVDPQLGALLENPILQPAIRRAGLLSAGRGTPVDLKSGQMTVGQLQDLKMALDDVIKNPETFGIGASEAQLIGTLQKQLVKVVGDKSPAWGAAREGYAAASKPINQMEVGQYLEGKLTPALSDLGASGSQRAQVYAQALRDAPGTLKRATGQPRYEELGKVLTEPGQMEAVTGVGRDLAREATRERLARAGTEQAGRIMGRETPTLPAVGPLEQKYMIVKTVLNRIKGNLSDRQLESLAIKMQNAPEVARIMELTGPARARAEAGLLRRAALAVAIEQARQ